MTELYNTENIVLGKVMGLDDDYNHHHYYTSLV